MLSVVKFLIAIGHPIYVALAKIGSWVEGKRIIPLSYRQATVYLILSVIFLTGSIVGLVFYREVLIDLPEVTKIDQPPRLSTVILDRYGSLLYKFYSRENRTWIPLSKIPQSLVWATLAIEDKDFYQHPGFSPKGLIQAVIYDLKTGGANGLRGGSTITQQLVKNVYLKQEKTWKRKMQEIVLALLLEWRLSKNQILERYFNQVSYGGEIYGVQEAAYRYFGKNVWEITLSEAAFLAGLPAAPSTYSIYGPNRELALVRQSRVLEEMATSGYIDKNRIEEIKASPLKIKEDGSVIKFPHFVFYVKDFVKEKYGLESLESAGLTITTSIEPEIQLMAEREVEAEVKKVANLRISNGAALVVAPISGDVLAMVGSKDYYANDIDGKYNVTTALRQPGSSIKPINYLLALKNGKTLLSEVEDSPVSYQIKGQKPYVPQNYNGKYMGKVTLKTALASSLNIPSVKLLAENGVENMTKLAKEMGITSWEDKSRWGLALALGSNEVKMVEMASAYSIFANMGNKVEINPVIRIIDYNGGILWQKKPIPKKIIEPEYAFLINETLSSDSARAPIFGNNSKLNIKGKTVAVKTGTTNNLKDNWCIGWNTDYLVAAWVGNNDSSPMSWVASGVSGATPIWNRVMSELLKTTTDKKWTIPENIIRKNVCGKDEYFAKGSEAKVKCISTPTPTPTL